MVPTLRDQMWGWGGVQRPERVHLTVETLCCVDASVSRVRDGGGMAGTLRASNGETCRFWSGSLYLFRSLLCSPLPVIAGPPPRLPHPLLA